MTPVLVFFARESELDGLLTSTVAPLLRDLIARADVRNVFFHRSVKPSWSVRLCARGLSQSSAADLAPPLPAGAHFETDAAQPDVEPTGAAVHDALDLCFQMDSFFTLDVLALEQSGRLARSRREVHLLFTDRLLERMGLDRVRRAAVYRLGVARPFEQGTWQEQDREALDARYGELHDALAELLAANASGNESETWGGDEAALAALATLDTLEEPLAALRHSLSNAGHARDAELTGQGAATGTAGEAAGSVIAGDAVALPGLDDPARAERAGDAPEVRGLDEAAHLLAQRQANRLGIDGLGEAVLRYLALRLTEDGRTPAP